MTGQPYTAEPAPDPVEYMSRPKLLHLLRASEESWKKALATSIFCRRLLAVLLQTHGTIEVKQADLDAIGFDALDITLKDDSWVITAKEI